jgi:hypothetical protein
MPDVIIARADRHQHRQGHPASRSRHQTPPHTAADQLKCHQALPPGTLPRPWGGPPHAHHTWPRRLPSDNQSCSARPAAADEVSAGRRESGWTTGSTDCTDVRFCQAAPRCALRGCDLQTAQMLNMLSGMRGSWSPFGQFRLHLSSERGLLPIRDWHGILRTETQSNVPPIRDLMNSNGLR